MKKESRKDLRVIKTDRNIKASFIRLLKKKTFGSITVQDILEEALINRTTFYHHFSSKYELAEVIAEELLAKYDQALHVWSQRQEEGGDLYDQLDEIGVILREDREAILAMWNIRTDTIHLYEDMCSHLNQWVSAVLKEGTKFQIDLAIAVLMTMLRSMLTQEEVSARQLHDEAIQFYEYNLMVHRNKRIL